MKIDFHNTKLLISQYQKIKNEILTLNALGMQEIMTKEQTIYLGVRAQ